jgi:hypothetical protein
LSAAGGCGLSHGECGRLRETWAARARPTAEYTPILQVPAARLLGQDLNRMHICPRWRPTMASLPAPYIFHRLRWPRWLGIAGVDS